MTRPSRLSITLMATLSALLWPRAGLSYDFLQTGVSNTVPIGVNGSINYFFSLPGNGQITISLRTDSATVSNEGFLVLLYNSDRTLLYQSANVLPGNVANIVTRDLPPNAHYIVYIAGFDGNDYASNFDGGTFTITASHETLYTDDDFGDTTLVATKLGKNSTPCPAIIETATDEDWFTFDLVDTGEIWAGVADVTGSTNYELRDQWGTTLAIGSADAVTSKGETYFDALPQGRYFLRVSGEAGTTYKSFVNFQLIPTSAETDDVSGGYENSFALNSVHEHSYSLDLNDQDFFYVHQPVEGPFRADIIFIHTLVSNESVDVYLRDRNGAIRARGVNSNQLPESIIIPMLPAGLYYLQVYGLDSNDYASDFNTGVYTAKAEVYTGAGDDAPDTMSKALLLSERIFNGAIDGASDTDMFCAFLADEGDPMAGLVVTVDRIMGAGVDVRVLDAGGTELGKSQNPGEADESILLMGLPKGFYFIEIKSAENSRTAYRIQTKTKYVNTSTLTDDIGNSIEQSLPLPAGYKLAGSLAVNDADYFSFDVPHASHVRVALTDMLNAVSNETIDLDIYDSAGTKIHSSQNSTTLGELIDVQRMAGGRYYARVVGKDGNDYASNYDGGLFAILVTVDTAWGDVSGDGTISPYDASLVLRHLSGDTTLDANQIAVGDVDGVDGLSESDAQTILEFAVGNIISFPVE